MCVILTQFGLVKERISGSFDHCSCSGYKSVTIWTIWPTRFLSVYEEAYFQAELREDGRWYGAEAARQMLFQEPGWRWPAILQRLVVTRLLSLLSG
jgi:hypothetical protein